MSAIKVLFIGGAGRSGSTLLETVLGQIDGIVSLGEFDEIWKAGVIENRLCGCGKYFLECDFWISVLQESFGGLNQVDIRNLIDAQKGACRVRHIPMMAWPAFQSRRYKKQFEMYRDVNKQLFQGIKRVTGAQVIVDSSKTAAQAFMISTIENIDLHILQLVRDSRAVAYSWQRKKKYPDAQRGDFEMIRKTPVESAVDWNLRNFFLEIALKGRRSSSIKSYSLVRYEDFTKSPMAILSALASRLELHTNLDSQFVSSSTIHRNHAVHTLEGNPSKFRNGNIEIRSDEEWKSAMPLFDRAVVSILTAPYLRKFGYI